MSESIVIRNCRLCGDGTGGAVSILISGGRIAEVAYEMGDVPGATVIEASGLVAAPGLIDVHIQGAGGADVLDGTAEALSTIARTCARFGVTGFLATTVYKDAEDNEHLRVAADCTGADLGGAELLGTHLEGPFISLKKRGMIQPECICEPCTDVMADIERVCGTTLRMMTIAPELDGVAPILEKLQESAVVASFGHSMADYEQTLAGFDAGISHVTHTFNAMASTHHRDPGPFVAITERGDVTCQVISDGVHLHPAIVRVLCDTLGIERIVPITDAMQAMGLPDGEYVYNDITYQSKAGAARYGDGTLIGTALGLNQVLARLVQYSGCTVAEAIGGATALPAEILGISDRKGSIEVGKDADIVLLDEDFGVAVTIARGAVVYRR